MRIVSAIKTILKGETPPVQQYAQKRIGMICFHDEMIIDFQKFEKEMSDQLFETEPQLIYTAQLLEECSEYMNYCKQNYPHYLKACLVSSNDYSFENYVKETASRMINFIVYASTPTFCQKMVDMDPDSVVLGIGQYFSAICESRFGANENACHDYLSRAISNIVYWIAVKRYPAKMMRCVLKIVGENLFDEDYTRYIVEVCLLSFKENENVIFH